MHQCPRQLHLRVKCHAVAFIDSDCSPVDDDNERADDEPEHGHVDPDADNERKREHVSANNECGWRNKDDNDGSNIERVDSKQRSSDDRQHRTQRRQHGGIVAGVVVVLLLVVAIVVLLMWRRRRGHTLASTATTPFAPPSDYGDVSEVRRQPTSEYSDVGDIRKRAPEYEDTSSKLSL